MSTQRQLSIPHSVWAAGHIGVLLGSLWMLLGLISFSVRSYAFKFSMAGALVSWGIVVYKSLGTPQLSKSYIHRALLDENFQYLLLAVYWLTTKPIFITLIPFATFSLFHTLTFVRTSILPKFNSSATPTPGKQTSGLNKTIQTWVKAHYEQAMLFVAYVEVFGIAPRLLLGAITFQNSFISIFVFVHFLRLRYFLSPSTRKAFAYLNSQIDGLLPSLPQGVRNVVISGRSMLTRYCQSILTVNTAGTAAAEPVAAAAAAATPRQ